MQAQPTASHFIGGKYIEDTSGALIESRYPATNEVIAQVHAGTEAIVAQAIEAADTGFQQWRTSTPAQRAAVLNKAAQIMQERNRELSQLETLDTGKPLQETLVADAASGAEALAYFASIAATMTGQHIALGNSFALVKPEPLGICVGIGAWNYPIQIAAWKAAPCLAAGNAMIFKPSEMTPLTALKLAEIFKEAGLPDGVFNVVQGAGETGAALVSHPRVAKVSLTGSVPTGTKVAQLAAAGLKPATLELGGKSPLIVFADADLDNAVGAAMNANFYSTGQICSNGTRVFVESSVKAAFLEKLVARTKAIKLGNPMDESVQLGPLVSAAQLARVQEYIDIGKQEGAQLVYGGARAEPSGFANGNYIEPTIFADVQDDMRIAREEIFGPVMSVLAFESEEEVVKRANATGFGLAAGVFAGDLQRGLRVVDALDAGTCWVNNYNLTPVEMPFGGYKDSGIGRENGLAAIQHYSQSKSILVELGDVEAGW
ncbi:betaine-aldehyde dehydrogenase [Polycladidibacter hongkongensis]|uniref:betaine-aldehyde dehydrogenase n=1 Tax=Polycladidibacter hongkongensis TaxID=1647556 RepID=UPI0008341DD7|nr:betaine-aldehyde dehydrogenase [Pseudovibrio hongkongensis]